MIKFVDSPVEVMEEQAPLTRRERRAARTERSLLNAALNVFLDRGLTAATIEEITQRADVGKGTFYIYFSSKSTIFEMLVCTAMKRLMARIRAAERDADSLRSAIERLVGAELEFYQEHPDEFRLIAFARTLLQLNEIHLPDSAEVFEKYFHLVEQVIRRQTAVRLEAPALRRIAILLASISSGYLGFAAFDINSQRMMLAFRPVREAMVNAVVELVESQTQGKAAAAEGAPTAPAVASA